MMENATDVLVIGGGLAGACAAHAARAEGARVTLLSKEPLGIGDTKISTGIFAHSEVAPEDSAFSLASDILASGQGLAREPLVDALARECPAAYDTLRQWGLAPELGPHGPRALHAPMGGHHHRRSIPHPARGVAFGAALARRLDAGDIEVRDDVWTAELIEHRARVSGALGFCARRGQWARWSAGAVVLATGGLGALYAPHTDVMRSSTGDGYSLAMAVGAALVDMEQVQFTPFGCVSPAAFVGLPLGESVLAGPRGRLIDHTGETLEAGVARWTRGALAARIASEPNFTDGAVRLDLSDNRSVSGWVPAFRRDFDHVLRRVKKAYGARAARFEEPWPVCPTAHYHMGGIRIEPNGRTGVPGLWAAGQVSGGIHGGNRLGSTSLPTAAVFGLRAGADAAHHRVTPPERLPDVSLARWRRPGLEAPLKAIRELQRSAWSHAGPMRSGAALAEWIDSIPVPEDRAGPGGRAWDTEVMQRIELFHLRRAALAVGHAALSRTISLGAHHRADESGAPDPKGSVVCRQGDEGSIIARWEE